MLLFAHLFALLPLAAATFGNIPVCGTTTDVCTRTTTVPGTSTTTEYCTVGAWCTSTITKPITQCKTTVVTSTSTKTKTPVVYVTGTPTKTVTRTACVATQTVCVDNWKRADIPLEMTNGERLRLGLPIRTVDEEKRWEEEKRFFWWPAGPSCTPTTVVSTAYVTKTKPATVKSTATTCLLTSVKYEPTITLVTRTDTCYATITAPPVTETRACLNPTTTTTVRTTATVTKKCWGW